jgi:hypothetical protein
VPKKLNFIDRSRGEKLPGKLEEEPARASGVGDVFELVAKCAELFNGAVKRALDLVLGEDAVVELAFLAAPEAVEERGVRETLDVLGDVAVVEDDVGLVGALRVFEGLLGLFEENIDVLVASTAKAVDELLFLLSELFFARGLVGFLGAAEISGGNHFVDWVDRELGVNSYDLESRQFFTRLVFY